MTFGLPYIFWRLLAALLALVGMIGVTVFALLPALHIARPYTIPTRTMAPTIDPGDSIYSYEWAYREAKPQRGDIVVFSSEGIDELNTHGTIGNYVKRVVGLPGETISIHDGNVWVDGKAAPGLARFNYQPAGDFANDSDAPYVVPADSYFVLGDNPEFSKDSRYWGSVPAKNLRGRAVWRLWPPARIGAIH